MRLLRYIAVWLLMLTLPLQALAAYAPMMPCGDAHAAAVQPSVETPMDHQAMMTAADTDQSPCTEHQSQNSSSDFDGHSCCHPVFTGVAQVVLPFAPQAPRAVMPRIALLNTLFIPELPQRPPRA
jgi:hypothetical protein